MNLVDNVMNNKSFTINNYCNCQKSADICSDVTVESWSNLLNMHVFRSFQICHNVSVTIVISNKPSEFRRDFSIKIFYHFKKLGKPFGESIYSQELTNQTTLTYGHHKNICSKIFG